MVRLLLADGDPVAVLELHHQLVEVERVGVEVLLEAGPLADPLDVDFELLGEVLADQGEDFLARHRTAVLSRSGSPATARRDRRRPRRSSAAVRADRVDLGAAGGEPDRVGDPLGAGAAVADDGDPAQAEQDRATGGVGVQLAPQAVQRRFQQQAAERGERVGAGGVADRGGDRLRRPLEQLQAMLPVKPSVTTTSTVAAGRSRPSTLPAKSMPGARLSRRCASTTSSRPLPASSPTVSRPTAVARRRGRRR